MVCEAHCYLAIVRGQLLFIETEVQGSEEQESTMANIAKHHSEKEGEGHNGEETRIDFTVAGNTVSINDTLETFSEFVCAMICRAGLFGM